MNSFEIDSINPTHVLVVLTVVAVVYAVWMMYFIWQDSRRMNGKGPRNKRNTCQSENNKLIVEDVMGKSKPVFEKSVPPPLQTDAIVGNVPAYPRQIPPDELDAVFGAAPNGETNEPLDIDHPLYVEPQFSGYEDENEALPLRGKHFAHGVRFEELGDAYHRVAYNPPLTDTKKEETGRILLDLKPTDMFEYIVSGDPKREDRMTYLMDFYLTKFHERKAAKEAERQPSPKIDIPPGVDIRKYF